MLLAIQSVAGSSSVGWSPCYGTYSIVLPTDQSAINAEQLFDNETLTRFAQSRKLQSAQMARQEKVQNSCCPKVIIVVQERVEPTLMG